MGHLYHGYVSHNQMVSLGGHHPAPGGVPATEHYVEVLDPEGQVRRWNAKREATFFVTECATEHG